MRPKLGLHSEPIFYALTRIRYMINRIIYVAGDILYVGPMEPLGRVRIMNWNG